MGTDDIFKFFSDHYPSHIEWIDDTSCNVVWKDENSAASAILDMSRPNCSKSTEETEQVFTCWYFMSRILAYRGLAIKTMDLDC